MTEDERDAFLADVHVGVLAVERTGGPPLVTPVWYRYQPGGVVELTTEAGSVKAQLMTAAGRATLCAQREQPPYAYVTVEGPVSMGQATAEIRTDIAVRYLGDEAGRAYVESAPAADDVVVRLQPERWRTVDYGRLDLDASTGEGD